MFEVKVTRVFFSTYLLNAGQFMVHISQALDTVTPQQFFACFPLVTQPHSNAVYLWLMHMEILLFMLDGRDPSQNLFTLFCSAGR